MKRITIQLDSKLRRHVARAARNRRMKSSEYIRCAIQDKLWDDTFWDDTFDESCRLLLIRAKSIGIYTDEDVFKHVS
jgi:predicted transcriptional regulator